MKKSINEAAKLKRLAGLITESEYQEAVMQSEEKMEEAVDLKIKGYYQVLDAGMDEWNDDFQYMGKVAGGSSAGEAGERMFAAPDAPGSFIFVTVPEADLDTMVKPSMNEEKEKEEGFGGINENALRNSFLSPEAYDRMSGLSNTRAQQAMIKAAEIMMNDLTAEGFEVEEIREFFHILIANDI
jgi:hypothetical protein